MRPLEARVFDGELAFSGLVRVVGVACVFVRLASGALPNDRLDQWVFADTCFTSVGRVGGSAAPSASRAAAPRFLTLGVCFTFFTNSNGGERVVHPYAASEAGNAVSSGSCELPGPEP